MESARAFTVRLLLRTFAEGSYSQLLLNQTLQESGLTAEDRHFCTMLYYGVVERALTLEHIVRTYSDRPPEKLDNAVRYILYTGLYQLNWCEKIPERAAVYETVSLCGTFRKKSAAGFVNAVLRKFLREGKAIPLPEDLWQARQVQYSAPAELIRTVWEEHGQQKAETFFQASLQPPPLTIRLNHIRAKPQDIPGLQPIPSEPAEYAYFLDHSDPAHMEAFRKGFFHVQDLAPQLCCRVLDPQPGETVLDVCAAPGGKTFTIAESMQNQGIVLAFDLHPKRVKLIRDGAERLGLTCIQASVQDAKQFNPDIPQADRVLCDVPCSGYGVIRRKPEIKYKPLTSVSGLPEIQSAILANAAKYLKPGGILVYATCTILRAENEAVAEQFLQQHPDFAADMPDCFDTVQQPGICLMERADCDGFFIARFRKRA